MAQIVLELSAGGSAFAAGMKSESCGKLQVASGVSSIYIYFYFSLSQLAVSDSDCLAKVSKPTIRYGCGASRRPFH